MQAQVIKVVEESVRASDEERVTFPQVVKQLIDVGVERYHADLLRGERIFYLPDGESHRVDAAAVTRAVPLRFSADGVEAAVRAIQSQKIGYRQFCEDIAAAGCVGYLVSVAGRRAVYYGRTGETFVEPFPSPK